MMLKIVNECAYCKKKAVTEDFLGLPSCKEHENSADNYYEEDIEVPEDYYENREKYEEMNKKGILRYYKNE